MQYFQLGEVVIRENTGEEHTITGVITERRYQDPVAGVWVEIAASQTLPGYWLDDIKTTTDDGLYMIFQGFLQSGLRKKYQPGDSLESILDKLKSEVY